MRDSQLPKSGHRQGLFSGPHNAPPQGLCALRWKLGVAESVPPIMAAAYRDRGLGMPVHVAGLGTSSLARGSDRSSPRQLLLATHSPSLILCGTASACPFVFPTARRRPPHATFAAHSPGPWLPPPYPAPAPPLHHRQPSPATPHLAFRCSPPCRLPAAQPFRACHPCTFGLPPTFFLFLSPFPFLT